MIPNRTAPASQIPFDYGQLDPAVRADVEGATRRIHDLERRTSESIIEIGKHLLVVKERVGHGHFGAWLKSEFEWSQDTAGRFMKVAETLGQNPQIAEYAQPSALYELASESTPETVRIEFIERAQTGAKIRHKDVKDAIEQHKIAERREHAITVRYVERPTPEPTTVRVRYVERPTPEPMTVRVVYPSTSTDDDEYPEVPSEVVDLSPDDVLVAGALRQEPASDRVEDVELFPDSTPEQRQAVATALHALLTARQRPDGGRVTLTEAIEHLAAHGDVDTRKWFLTELLELRMEIATDSLVVLRRGIDAHR